MHIHYGQRIMRPEFCVTIIPPAKTPAWVVALAIAVQVLKAFAVIVLTLLAAAVLALHFPQAAFQTGLLMGILGFVAWQAIK